VRSRGPRRKVSLRHPRAGINVAGSGNPPAAVQMGRARERELTTSQPSTRSPRCRLMTLGKVTGDPQGSGHHPAGKLLHCTRLRYLRCGPPWRSETKARAAVKSSGVAGDLNASPRSAARRLPDRSRGRHTKRAQPSAARRPGWRMSHRRRPVTDRKVFR